MLDPGNLHTIALKSRLVLVLFKIHAKSLPAALHFGQMFPRRLSYCTCRIQSLAEGVGRRWVV